MQTIFVPGSRGREPAAGAAGRREGTAGLVVGNLAKSYKGRPVLRDVSLELRRGEVAALLGPNGAGKTTCFYAIAGLVPPDRGTITVDGQDVTWLPMYRRAKLGIGYLPQEASIFRGMTVADNIRAILEITVQGRREAPRDARRADGRVLDHPPAPGAGDRALGRRAAAGGDRPLPGGAAEVRAARRAVRRRRPAGGRRHPQPGAPPEGPRHRGADHRPQRARDVGNRRPSLYPARRHGADDRHARGSRAGRQCAARLPWRQLPHPRAARFQQRAPAAPAKKGDRLPPSWPSANSPPEDTCGPKMFGVR